MTDDRIDDRYKWGQHIPLTCVNHPDLRWSTKNIGYIGARSIFYTSWQVAPECACKGSDLRPLPHSIFRPTGEGVNL